MMVHTVSSTSTAGMSKIFIELAILLQRYADSKAYNDTWKEVSLPAVIVIGPTIHVVLVF